MKRFAEIYQKISIEHLWPLVVMVGIIAFLNTHPVMPHDYWWHMAIGRDILSEGAIPMTDIYSYTQPGAPYPSYQQFWLMDIILYLVYQAGGLILTILVQTLMVGSAYGLILWLAFLKTRNWRAAALAVLFAAALGFGNWNVRPQAVTYFFAVLFLLANYHLGKGGNKFWLLVYPVGMMLWVNSHGSFPIGFALVGIWWLEEALPYVVKRQIPELHSHSILVLATSAGLLALLGVLINPRGVGFISYLSTLTGNSIVQTFITEWMPPTFDTLEGSVFLFVLLGIAVLMAISPRRPNLSQVLYFLVFGYLSLKYIRGVVWFGLVMAPFVAEDIAAFLNRAGIVSSPVNSISRRLNFLLVSVMFLLLGVTLPWFKPWLPFLPEKAGLVGYETPVEATQYMLDHKLPGRVFHGMGFGSYLIWAAQPAYPVFVDSRIEMYPPEIWNEYMEIGNGVEGWEEMLNTYGVNTLMLEPKNQAGLINAASQSREWDQVYSHPAVVILVRRSLLERQGVISESAWLLPEQSPVPVR